MAGARFQRHFKIHSETEVSGPISRGIYERVSCWIPGQAGLPPIHGYKGLERGHGGTSTSMVRFEVGGPTSRCMEGYVAQQVPEWTGVLLDCGYVNMGSSYRDFF